MPTGTTSPSDPATAVRELATVVRNRHRGQLRELRIEVVESGVVLHGRARSFYGKQIAFHEVRRLCALVVVENRIEVQEHSVEAPPEAE
jgi:hypothetical protein